MWYRPQHVDILPCNVMNISEDTSWPGSCHRRLCCVLLNRNWIGGGGMRAFPPVSQDRWSKSGRSQEEKDICVNSLYCWYSLLAILIYGMCFHWRFHGFNTCIVPLSPAHKCCQSLHWQNNYPQYTLTISVPSGPHRERPTASDDTQRSMLLWWGDHCSLITWITLDSDPLPGLGQTCTH